MDTKNKFKKSDLFRCVKDSWLPILDKPELDQIVSILNDLGHSVCPTKELIFAAFEFFQVADMKIIIIGQDPYSNKEDACGLAFTSRRGVPASAKNILRCLKAHDLLTDPAKGAEMCADFTFWAEQGVLLLNKSLTCTEGASNSHVGLWDAYTKSLLEHIATVRPDVPVFAWGRDAQIAIRGLKFSTVLTWSHPSPLADNRLSVDKKFVNCDHFIRYSNIITWDYYNTFLIVSFNDATFYLRIGSQNEYYYININELNKKIVHLYGVCVIMYLKPTMLSYIVLPHHNVTSHMQVYNDETEIRKSIEIGDFRGAQLSILEGRIKRE